MKTIEELQTEKCWIMWKPEWDEKQQDYNKTPYSPFRNATGKFRKAASNDPSTWDCYEGALAVVNNYDFMGVGLELTKGIAAIDIDCHDSELGLNPLQTEILELFSDTYCEVSPSGKGIHILFCVDFDKLPVVERTNGKGLRIDERFYVKNSKSDLECYVGGATNRYMTFTGNMISDKPVLADCTGKLMYFLYKYMRKNVDTIEKLLDKARNDKRRGDIFKRLYDEGDISDYNNDHSSADEALMNDLVYWLNGNYDDVLTAFYNSKLDRSFCLGHDADNADKGNKTQRDQYMRDTFNKAMDGRTDFYVPKSGRPRRNKGDSADYADDNGYDEYVNDKGKLMIGAFSDFIRDKYNIIKLDGDLYFYNEGVYIRGDDKERYIETFLEKHYDELTNAQTKECMGKLYRRIEHNSVRTSERYIAFKNGVFDVDNGVFTEGHNPNYIFTSMIPFDYPTHGVDENGTAAEFIKKVFNSWCCDNTELVNMLFQIIGHTFYRKNIFSPVFILSGDGQNGKSTFLNLVEYILNGDCVFENTSNLTIQELNQRFKRIRLKDKLANICNDIPSDYLEDPSILKMLASGEAFDVEPKGKDGFTIRPYATMIVGANDIPRFNDMSQGTIRRMFIIPFDRVFTDKDADFDPNLPKKLRDNTVIEYVIYESVQWLIKMIHNNGFFVPQTTLNERKELEYRNNSALAFLSELNYETDIVNQTVPSVYRKYIRYCNENGIPSKNNLNFGRAVCKMFGVKGVAQRVNGETVKVYRMK